MTALTVNAQSGIYREKVGANDTHVYIGVDSNVYIRNGNSGAFNVLAPLNNTGSLITLIGHDSRRHSKICISTTGFVLCVYAFAVGDGSYGSEYRLYSVAGSLIASGLLTAQSSFLSNVESVTIPIVSYDYVRGVFRFAWQGHLRSMGADYYELYSNRITEAGVLETPYIVESRDVASGFLGYKYGHYSNNYNEYYVYGATRHITFGVLTKVVYSTSTPTYFAPTNTDTSVYHLDGSLLANSTGVFTVAHSLSTFIIYSIDIGTFGANVYRVVNTPNELLDTAEVLGVGISISTDLTEFYVRTLTISNADDYILWLHSFPATVARNALRSATLIASEVVTFGAVVVADTPPTGLSVFDKSTSSARVSIFWQGGNPYPEYEDSWIPSPTLPSVEAVIDVVLQPISVAMSASISPVNLTPSGVLSIQLTHSLSGFVFSSLDGGYRLYVNGLLIPMVNFTVTKYTEFGISRVSIRAVIPVGYYVSLAELVGANLDVFRYVGIDSKLIAASKMVSLSKPEGNTTVTIYSDAIFDNTNTGAVVTNADQFYERNQNNNKTVRIAPNTNIDVGSSVEYGKHKAQIKAGRVVTFIGQDQSFTEVTA